MAPKPKRKRLLSVDLLRGLAVLVMIETHVVGLMLRPALRSTVGFDVLDLVNGLVAPAFLFTAGFAFVLASRRMATHPAERGLVLRKMGWRIATIWVLGYLMRLPSFTPSGLRHASEAAWQNFIAVDVLHCIALGWVILLGMRLVCRSDVTFRRATLGAAMVFLVGAPFVWSLDLQASLPMALAAYFNAQSGSLFPVFPWFFFMASGAAAGMYYLKARETDRVDR